MEVLEHLEKEDGAKLIFELERVAKKQVLITTPIGKYDQHAYDGNPYQEHKYLWQPSQLKDKGYRIKGAGFRGIPREGVNSSVARLLRDTVYILGGFVSYCYPDIGCHITAEKKFYGNYIEEASTH